jgi:hypothetical protein
MPAIDLARLRKQAARLADFFLVPDDFLRHLHEMLEFYVNRSLRRPQAAAPASNLQTYRTPAVVLQQIQTELGRLAGENPDETLELADRLWDAGYLETRLLAAFLLGRIPPEEKLLLARLTAWTQQIRDPSVRAALLTDSLERMRRERPEQFLLVVAEWLQPERPKLWPNGLQALRAMVTDPEFENLPPVLKLIEPIVVAGLPEVQLDLKELILALFRTAPEETTYFLRQTLTTSINEMTAITMRRISTSFPPELESQLHDLIRPAPLSKGD